MVRAFNAFLPKFITGLHPQDGLRLAFEEFVVALKELGITVPSPPPIPALTAAEQLPSLPIEVLPTFIEFIQSDSTLAEGLKDLFTAFTSYIRQVIIPGTVAGEGPKGVEARQLQINAALNLGRLMVVAEETIRESEAPLGREALAAILENAQIIASKSDGMRIAEWFLSPSRPGSENLPVIGFTLPDGGKGLISLYPGIKRRDEGEEELPAGGRLVYEGEGIGRVEIGLEYGKDGLSTLFITPRKDVHEDIQAGLPVLAESLDARGVKVKSLRSFLRTQPEESKSPEIDDDMSLTGLDLKA
jgi:hypothetical protein